MDEKSKIEKKPSPKKKAAPKQTVKDEVIEEVKNRYTPTELDPHMYVTVKNGFTGTLVYQSSKTGETFIFDDFGDEHEIELSELKNAKNSMKQFYINNWFLIDDPEVIAYLGVGEFYKNALKLDEYTEIFNMDADSLRQRLRLLSNGQKQSIAFLANKLISQNRIDSISVIKVLEEELNVVLMSQ